MHVLDARTLDPSHLEKLTVPHPTFSRPRTNMSRIMARPNGPPADSTTTAGPSTSPWIPDRPADPSAMLPWRGTSGWVDAMQRNVARYITNHVGSRQTPARTSSSEAVEGLDAEPCPELDPALASSTPANAEEPRTTRTSEDDYESALRSFMDDARPTATDTPILSALLNMPTTLGESSLRDSPSSITIYAAGAESWEDIIGMAWSPDGERLCAATEDSVVEWRVDGSVRRGFGDKGLL